VEGFVGGVEYWEKRDARESGRLIDDWAYRREVAAKELWIVSS
jgi:hypothetical protein